jgi:hypothetical protein
MGHSGEDANLSSLIFKFLQCWTRLSRKCRSSIHNRTGFDPSGQSRLCRLDVRISRAGVHACTHQYQTEIETAKWTEKFLHGFVNSSHSTARAAQESVLVQSLSGASVKGDWRITEGALGSASSLATKD